MVVKLIKSIIYLARIKGHLSVRLWSKARQSGPLWFQWFTTVRVSPRASSCPILSSHSTFFSVLSPRQSSPTCSFPAPYLTPRIHFWAMRWHSLSPVIDSTFLPSRNATLITLGFEQRLSFHLPGFSPLVTILETLMRPWAPEYSSLCPPSWPEAAGSQPPSSTCHARGPTWRPDFSSVPPPGKLAGSALWQVLLRQGVTTQAHRRVRLRGHGSSQSGPQSPKTASWAAGVHLPVT